MAKIIILSIILVSFGVPLWLAAAPRPRQALRRVQWILFVYIVVWAFLCLRVYPQLVPLE